ncbi:MAG: type II secretion system protein [Victivallaceae bacterium]
MKNSKSKFTLIELLLSVMILTIALGLITSISASIVKASEKIFATGKQLQDYQRLSSIADNCLRNIIPFTWPDSNSGEEKLFFYGKNDEIYFAYLHPAFGEQENGLRFVKIYRQGSNLMVAYSNEPIFGHSDDMSSVTTETLLTNIDRLQFKYAIEEKNEIIFVEQYDNKIILPLAVDWQIIDANGEQLRFLRRTAGNSAYSRMQAQNVGEGNR